MYSTQLSDFRDYDLDNLILQLPERRFEDRNHSNSDGNENNNNKGFQRIRIMTHHLDGTRGDLILSTPRLLTFGLQEQLDTNTQEVIGYQMPLILWGKNGPSEEEKRFIDTIQAITDITKDFIMDNKDNLDRANMDRAELHRLSPLYYKMDKGEIQKDRAPLLYTKLNIYRQDGGVQVRTLFTDEVTKEPVDPLQLINRRCFIHGAIRLESIIIGNRVRPRFQVKLFEARVRFLDNGFKSLLEPGKVFPKARVRGGGGGRGSGGGGSSTHHNNNVNVVANAAAAKEEVVEQFVEDAIET